MQISRPSLLWYWPFFRPDDLVAVQALAEIGFNITVQTLVDHPEGWPALQSDQWAFELLADLPTVHKSSTRASRPLLRGNTYYRRFRQRSRQIKRSNPHLIHVNYINRFTDWRKITERPLVVTVHDVMPHNRRLPDPLERSLLAKVYSQADTLIVHHEWLQRRLLEDFRIGAEKIHVAEYPVPQGRRPVEEQSLSPTVLLFGTLRPNKGISFLLDALQHIERPDLRIIVAGQADASQERLIMGYVKGDSRIEIHLGHVSDRHRDELFQRASIVALPYTSFTSQSGVLHDAYSYGLPVIVTDVGALGETVRADVSGIVVPPRDSKAIAAAILAISEPTEWKRLALGASGARMRRTPQKFANDLSNIYRSVLDATL